MCRNIKTLYNFEPPASPDEVRSAALQFVAQQLAMPVGTPPFHVIAPSSYVNWGPFNVGPVIVDAMCIDLTGGVIGPVSPVVRLTVQ